MRRRGTLQKVLSLVARETQPFFSASSKSARKIRPALCHRKLVDLSSGQIRYLIISSRAWNIRLEPRPEYLPYILEIFAIYSRNIRHVFTEYPPCIDGMSAIYLRQGLCASPADDACAQGLFDREGCCIDCM